MCIRDSYSTPHPFGWVFKSAHNLSFDTGVPLPNARMDILKARVNSADSKIITTVVKAFRVMRGIQRCTRVVPKESDDHEDLMCGELFSRSSKYQVCERCRLDNLLGSESL